MSALYVGQWIPERQKGKIVTEIEDLNEKKEAFSSFLVLKVFKRMFEVPKKGFNWKPFIWIRLVGIVFEINQVWSDEFE